MTKNSPTTGMTSGVKDNASRQSTGLGTSPRSVSSRFPPWSRYVIRRLWQSIPTIALILVLSFVLLHSAPGDVVDVLAGKAGAATPEFMSQLRAKYGLDRPITEQFFLYVGNVMTFDLGYSFRHNMPVSSLILSHIGPTVLLMASGLALALGLGITLGTISAMRAGGIVDGVISLLALVCYATPTFWIGLMAIVFFSIHLGWLPSGGLSTLVGDFTAWERALDVMCHLILPAATLALFYMAIYARIMRASILDVSRQDFVRTARAKGISERAVTSRHVLRNALLPVITLAGVQIGHLLGGSVLVETVFGWPGLGRLAYEAIFSRDTNLLMGLLLFSALVVIAVNLIIDLLYPLIDPRIERR